MKTKQETVCIDLEIFYKHSSIGVSGRRDCIVIVDKKHKFPGPMRRLIWGWTLDGEDASGDFKGYFTCLDSVTAVFDRSVPLYMTALQEKADRLRLIEEWIKLNREALSEIEHSYKCTETVPHYAFDKSGNVVVEGDFTTVDGFEGRFICIVCEGKFGVSFVDENGEYDDENLVRVSWNKISKQFSPVNSEKSHA